MSISKCDSSQICKPSHARQQGLRKTHERIISTALLINRAMAKVSTKMINATEDVKAPLVSRQKTLLKYQQQFNQLSIAVQCLSNGVKLSHGHLSRSHLKNVSQLQFMQLKYRTLVNTMKADFKSNRF